MHDEEKNISSQDFIYVFSLVLYYSCILQTSDFFRIRCQDLNDKHQTSIMKFFAIIKQALDKKQKLTKEIIRSAIKEAVPSSPALKFITSSPLKTPVKMPPTPNKTFYQEKTNELHKVKTMLENERYERNMLEVEVKQYEERIELLVKEQKSLKQELHRLRCEQMMDKDNENLSPNKIIRDEQVRVKMQKEIDSREEIIVNLRCDIEVLSSKNEKISSRMSTMQGDLKEMRAKLSDLDALVEEQKENLEENVLKIRTLEETNNELILFINESRRAGLKDSSSDSLDCSISSHNRTTESGENLAKYVIEVQLKEKEVENEQLQEKLSAMSNEKHDLEVASTAHGETVLSLQNELKEKTLANEDLTANISSLNSRLESLTKENEKLESAVQKSAEQVELMEKTVKQNMADLNTELKAAQSARNEFHKMLEDEKINFSNLRNDYENEIASNKHQLESLQAENGEQSALIEAKIAEIASLHDAHTAAIEDVLEKKAKDIEAMVNAKDANLSKIEAARSSLKLKFKESQLTRKALEESLHSKTQQLDQKVEQLQGVIASQASEVESLETLVKEIESEKLKFVETINAKEEELRNLSSEHKQQQNEMSHQIILLQNESEVTNRKILEALNEARANEQAIERSNIAILQVESEKKAQDEAMAQVTKEKAELQEKHQQQSLDLKRATDKLSKLAATLAENQQSALTEVKELQKQLQQLNDEILEKNSVIGEKCRLILNMEMKTKKSSEAFIKMKNNSVEHIAETDAILQKLKIAHNEILKERDALKCDLWQREQELAASKEQETQLNEVNKTFQLRIAELTKQVAESSAGNEIAHKQTEEAQSKFDKLLLNYEQNKFLLSSNQDETCQLRQNIETTNASLKDIQETKEKLEKQLIECTKLQENSVAEANQLKEEVKKLTTILSDTSTQKTDLETTNESFKKNLEALKAELESSQKVNREFSEKVKIKFFH